MPYNLGTTLTTSDHSHTPIRHIGRMEQVVIRMEHPVADESVGPWRNMRHEPGAEHDVLGVDDPVIDLHRKALVVDRNLAYFRAKFNVGQAGGHPLQVLIEFLST